MAKPPLARIIGTAITPGVSRNNRLYASQDIGLSLERAPINEMPMTGAVRT